MKKVENITEEKVTYTCDFCKKNNTHRSCNGCKKDICGDCIKSWDDRYSEDYPNKYCERCTKIRNSYSCKINSLQEQIDAFE